MRVEPGAVIFSTTKSHFFACGASATIRLMWPLKSCSLRVSPIEGLTMVPSLTSRLAIKHKRGRPLGLWRGKIPGFGSLPRHKPKGRPCGIYNAHLLEFLHEANLPIWLENSTQIKQAGGMQPRRRTGSKSDTVDARRVRRCGIAEYAYRFRDQMRLWEPPRQIIQQLSFLSTVRQRLI